MKKLILLSLLCLTMAFSSCTEGNTDEIQITEWRPSSTAEPRNTQTKIDFEVKEERVKLDNSKKTNTTTKATEETEEPTEATETTMPIPTQGVVNPNGHIPVTTALGSFSKTDVDFTYGKNTIKLNDSIENIFTAIGEDNVSQELSAKKMSYAYEDFTLYTYIDEKNNEKLEKIHITKDGISTSKGVKINDYASALVRIYGNATKQENGIKYYEKDSKQLIFKYKDNHITEIIYQYTSP